MGLTCESCLGGRHRCLGTCACNLCRRPDRGRRKVPTDVKPKAQVRQRTPRVQRTWGSARKNFTPRSGHIEGGSRWCYSQGCGHDDCYAKEHAYYEANKRDKRTKVGRPASRGETALAWACFLLWVTANLNKT